jgi:hypothetical protein
MTVSNPPGVRPAVKLTDAAWITLFAAIAAGSIDLVYASSFVREGVTMAGVMKSIASGLLGAEAFRGGASVAVLGALCHYGILWVAGAVFILVGRFWPIAFQRPLISGAVFGLGIFVVMKIVVTLSRAPFSVYSDIEQIVRALLVHVFLVGIPMAIIIVTGLTRAGAAAAPARD